MFKLFKKKHKPQTITEKVVLGNGIEINKVYDVSQDPEKLLKEIHAMAKDAYPFKTIMAALDSVQIRLNNIECRIMDLDKKKEPALSVNQSASGVSPTLKERILGMGIEELYPASSMKLHYCMKQWSELGIKTIKDLLDYSWGSLLKHTSRMNRNDMLELYEIIFDEYDTTHKTSYIWNRWTANEPDWKRLADKLGIKE